MGCRSHQSHVGFTLVSRPALIFLLEPLGRVEVLGDTGHFCLESGNQGSQGLGRSLIPSPAEPGWWMLGEVKEAENWGSS